MATQSFLEYVRYNHNCFLFVDPSIANMGLAAYQCTSDGKTVSSSLIHSEVVCRKTTDEPTHVRCRTMYRYVIAKVNELKVSRVYIEVPPDTIYEQKKLDRNQLIARAVSVFKLQAVTYSIFGALADIVKAFPISPCEWEVVKGKGGAKAWSLGYANLILTQQKKNRQLKEGVEQNEADAITMGDVILRKLAAQSLRQEFK
jgi:hypothetical protein